MAPEIHIPGTDEQRCIDLLQKLVASRSGARKLVGRRALGELVDDAFDDASLLDAIRSVREVIAVSQGEEGVLVEFADEDGHPHRARFIETAGGDWKLVSVVFRCPVCFGDGVNDSETCIACDGSGWGAS
jgi:hypothetical protein